jgi:hypothetical protein
VLIIKGELGVFHFVGPPQFGTTPHIPDCDGGRHGHEARSQPIAISGKGYIVYDY